MPYQDICHKLLDPSIWKSTELGMLGKVRGPLLKQLLLRFPEASSFWVVGELTTHFYGPDSTLDILVSGPKEKITQWEQDAEVLSSHRVVPSSVRLLVFVFVPSSVSPGVLASKFGALYDIRTEVWVGRRPGFGIMEVGTADALLKRINWELFKLRKTNSEADAELLGLKDAFGLLSSEERSLVLHSLAERIGHFDHLLSKALTNQPATVWRATDSLEQALLESDSVGAFLSSILEERPSVPTGIQNIVFHKHRYDQVLTELREFAEREHTQRVREDGPFGTLPIEAQTKKSGENKSMAQKNASFTVFGILRIDGSSSFIRSAKEALLKHHVQISSSSPTSLCLSRVKQEDLPKLERFLSRIGSFNLTTMDPQVKQHEVVAEPEEVSAFTPSTFLAPQKWYFADALEETYPFVFVKTPQAGQDSWEVELLTAQNTIPVKKILSTADLRKFSLRPATVEDFEERDLPQPEDRFLLTAAVKEEETPAKVEVASLAEWGTRKAARSAKEIDQELGNLIKERDAAEEKLFHGKHNKAQWKKLRKEVDAIQAKISALGEELEAAKAAKPLKKKVSGSGVANPDDFKWELSLHFRIPKGITTHRKVAEDLRKFLAEIMPQLATQVSVDAEKIEVEEITIDTPDYPNPQALVIVLIHTLIRKAEARALINAIARQIKNRFPQWRTVELSLESYSNADFQESMDARNR